MRRWSAGIVMSPMVSDRTTDYQAELFVPRFGYSAGLNVMYNLTSQLSIETGILYSRRGWNFTYDNLTFGDMIDPRFGFVYQAQEPTLSNTGYEFENLEVPVRLNWTLGKQKLRFTGSVGCLVVINLSAKETFEKLNTDIKKTGVMVSVGAGAVYYFNNRIAFRMQPEFQYSLFQPAVIYSEYYIMSLGMNTSVFYTF